jgi:hypothetical protein
MKYHFIMKRKEIVLVLRQHGKKVTCSTCSEHRVSFRGIPGQAACDVLRYFITEHHGIIAGTNFVLFPEPIEMKNDV